ncbi:hypothetical protein P152DRAFT_463556 [Eremomyces bilateralis CBS 781.70]|uniref:Zn(2)-C6 fungal-type domain-containing protein n=1 Tax=Eremomyces bilateralis CBS 781.70 TaxID=1392243 RepID=A0A6G1GH40_9PEZI|nr:uncharacterized protein P152DRAFT_463556 [Eremomyces bilateralis CBS 781.70]KAF1817388.1 hypothetical protein P152DRAFT_463556 [Eremomyces bilateralis CBS 781.70]
MPGVPSSRACDACRKQRKNCDQQRPACSRCARLQIACVGAGKQRFKFAENLTIEHLESRRSSSNPSPRRSLEAAAQPALAMPAAPSNELTLVTAAFLSTLQVTDIRFDPTVYGEFLKDIPRRLGTNAALDASVHTFSVAFPQVYSHKKSPDVVESYSRALAALRTSLDRPSEASSINTLCAIYLMIICQAWMGDFILTGHGELLSQLLRTVANQNWDDNFDYEVLLTLCVPVIVESIGNPRIHVQPWLDKLVGKREQAIPMKSMRLTQLAKIQQFLNDPYAHEADIRLTYQQLGFDLHRIQQVILPKISKTDQTVKMRSRFQVIYSILLSYATILNTILCRCFEPYNPILTTEGLTLVDGIVRLAEDATQYRPLGSSGMPLMLMAVWPAAKGTTQQTRVEELMTEYKSDFPTTSWQQVSLWLESRMNNNSKTRALKDMGPVADACSTM